MSRKILQLDGQSDAVELAPAHLIGLGAGDFTVEAWVRVDAWGSFYLPILGTAEAAQNIGLHLAIKDKKPYLGFYGNDTAGQTELTPGQWYHLAWRFTAAGGEQAIFVNGVLDAAATGKTPFQGRDKTVYAGRYAVDHHFKGRLAELRIWRVARSTEQILTHMHRQLAGSEAHLAAYWPLDQDSGQTAANRKAARPGDSSGATALTLSKPPSARAVRLDGGRGFVDVPAHGGLDSAHYSYEAWLRPDALPAEDDAVLIGRRRTYATSFDGANDYVNVPAGVVVGSRFTQEVWIFPTPQRSSYVGILANPDLGVGRCPIIYLYPGGKIHGGFGDGTHWNHFTTGSIITTNAWNHVATTFDGTSYKVYVNGQERFSTTAFQGRQPGNYHLRLIGRGGRTTSFFTGKIAEVRCWSHVRTQQQIAADMSRRLAGDESGLVGYWRLDHATGGQTHDATSHQRHGTVHGAALAEAGPLPVLRDGPGLLTLRPDGSLRHRYSTGAGLEGPDDVAAAHLPQDQWSHVAITNDGTTARTFVDGEQRSEGAVTALAAISGGLRLGEGFTGDLAAVRRWSVARSATEITAARDRVLTGTETGLAGNWPLDELSGTAVANRSSGGLGGLVVDGARIPLVPGTGALALDGASAHLEIAHAPRIHFSRPEQSFTLEICVRPGAAPAGAEDELVIVEKWSGVGSFPYALRYRPGDRRFVFTRSTGAAPVPVVVSTRAFAAEAFHHLAAVKAGNALRLYVDGELEGEAADPITATIRGSSPLYVGSRGGASHFFAGALSELRLWRGARSQSELRAGLGRRLTGTELGLAGYWPLGEVAGGKVSDGLARPAGTITGGDWIDGAGLPCLGFSTAAPATAPAAGFDGLASSIAVPAHADLMPAAALTVEAWLRPAATSRAGREGPAVASSDAVSGWQLHATDLEGGFLLTVDGVQHEVRWPATAGADQWTHLAGVYDGSRLQLYVNGVPVPGARKTVSGAVTPYHGELLIGGSPFWKDHHFKGQIAEVRVWSMARSAALIHAGLFRRLNGEEPGLVGYWPLSEGQGAAISRGGGSAGGGEADSILWVAADLPPRVEAATTPAADGPERLEILHYRLDDLQQKLAEENALIATYDLQRAELQRQVNEKQVAIDAERGAFKAPYDTRVAALDTKIAATNARQAALEEAGVDAFLEDLIKDTRTQIEDARQELAKKESSHGLERISMELKYVAGAEGHGAVFPALEAAVDPAQFTTLKLDFEPVRPAAPAVKKSAVPSLVGQTSAFARRQLAAAGFVGEFHAQAVRQVAGQPSQVGRVVSQTPTAGSELVPGGAVRLFLGKAS